VLLIIDKKQKGFLIFISLGLGVKFFWPCVMKCLDCSNCIKWLSNNKSAYFLGQVRERVVGSSEEVVGPARDPRSNKHSSGCFLTQHRQSCFEASTRTQASLESCSLPASSQKKLRRGKIFIFFLPPTNEFNQLCWCFLFEIFTKQYLLLLNKLAFHCYLI